MEKKKQKPSHTSNTSLRFTRFSSGRESETKVGWCVEVPCGTGATLNSSSLLQKWKKKKKEKSSKHSHNNAHTQTKQQKKLFKTVKVFLLFVLCVCVFCVCVCCCFVFFVFFCFGGKRRWTEWMHLKLFISSFFLFWVFFSSLSFLLSLVVELRKQHTHLRLRGVGWVGEKGEKKRQSQPKQKEKRTVSKSFRSIALSFSGSAYSQGYWIACSRSSFSCISTLSLSREGAEQLEIFLLPGVGCLRPLFIFCFLFRFYNKK